MPKRRRTPPPSVAAWLDTEPELSAKLSLAALLISEVRDTLDTDHKSCESCGCTVYSDWAEANAAKSLEGAVGRIERTIGVLGILASERGGR